MIRRLRAAALIPLLGGCAYGMHESARTVPPGRFSGAGAISFVTNTNTGARGGVGLRNFGVDLGMARVGVARHLDVGVGFLYGLGGRADVKLSPLPEDWRFALALRLGGGGAGLPDDVAMAYVGALASYDFAFGLSPYLGCTFANHWIYGMNRDTPLPGQTLASRAGYGDGLLESAFGVRIFIDRKARVPTSVSLEYSLWVPLQDDPGDGFSFILSHVASIGFCFGCPSAESASGAPR